MSIRKEDLIKQYLTRDDVVEACKFPNVFTVVYNALDLAFDQGESFGKYEKYAEKVADKYLIQPENDRAWQKELDDIMKDCRNTTCRSNESKTVHLLGLIAEIILYRRNGG